MKAEVLFQNSMYSIEKYFNRHTGKYSLCVIYNSRRTDWVIVYRPGHVAYDFPELLPQYIKDKVRKISLTLNT